MRYLPVILTVMVIAVAPTMAAEKPRALLGFGASYGEEHKLGAHLFTGVQFPRDLYKRNWQLQVGVDYQKHDDFDARGRIGCRQWTAHQDAPGPLKLVISGVVVF